MKIIKKLVFIFLLPIFMIAQSEWPGKDYELLLGATLKLVPKNEDRQKMGFSNFYKTEEVKITANGPFIDEVYYGSARKYKKAISKEFKVVNITRHNYFNAVLTLEQSPTKGREPSIVYFKYSTDLESLWPFEIVGGLVIPEGFYCSKIEIKNDKFTDKRRSYSPLLEDISLSKYEEEDVVTIYMSLKVNGSTLNLNGKGVILLLEDGSKINLPNETIEANVSDYGWEYTAFFSLSDENINKLKASPITDYRLYIYDKTIENGHVFCEYLKCLAP